MIFFAKRAATFTPGVLSGIKDKLVAGGRKLSLWVTLYTHELNESIKSHLEQIDVVTFWTWASEELENLEKNFKKFKQICPRSRKVLGCYMYDFCNKKLMPVDLMEKQCELGLKWLKAGEIEGIIFLSSAICDLKFEAVEWTRQWVQRVGEENI